MNKNKDIKGIYIDNSEYLISHYADDTVLILDGSEKSLNAALDELHLFGLKTNLSKPKLYGLEIRNTQQLEQMCENIYLKWTTTFKLLGIFFDVDLTNIPKINYVKKLVKIKNIINHWKKRLLGRISIIKSLLISQLNHLFISLPMPSVNYLKNLIEILFHYLWNIKVDRIKRKQITQI